MSGELRPFVVGIAGLELSDIERGLFKETPPAGVIHFLRNVDNPDQIRALNDEIKEISNGETKIYIDQEGGRVQRLAQPHWTQFPVACSYDGLEGDAFDRAIYAHHRLIGDELHKAGFDINCAPCLDLRSDITADFLKDRSFGGGVDRLVNVAILAKRGLLDAGIYPVAKHIPGHGRGQVDSHLFMPVVEFDTDPFGPSLPQDAAVFAALSDYPFGMCAHILYPQIDPDVPLTLSSKGFEFIRKNIGFSGIMLSDDLGMKALKGTQAELATQTLDAGADLALSCSGEAEDLKMVFGTEHIASDDLKLRLKSAYATMPEFEPLSQSARNTLMNDIEV